MYEEYTNIKKLEIARAISNEALDELVEILSLTDNRSASVGYAIFEGIYQRKCNPLVIAIMMKYSTDWKWDDKVKALKMAHAVSNTEIIEVLQNIFYTSYYEEMVSAKGDLKVFAKVYQKYSNDTGRLIEPLGLKLFPLIMSHVASVRSYEEKMAILNQARLACKHVAVRLSSGTAYVHHTPYENSVSKAIEREINQLNMMHEPPREGTHKPTFFGYAKDYTFGTVAQIAVYHEDETQKKTFELHRI